MKLWENPSVLKLDVNKTKHAFKYCFKCDCCGHEIKGVYDSQCTCPIEQCANYKNQMRITDKRLVCYDPTCPGWTS